MQIVKVVDQEMGRRGAKFIVIFGDDGDADVDRHFWRGGVMSITCIYRECKV